MATLYCSGGNVSPPRTGTDWLKARATKVSEGPQLPVAAQQAASFGVEDWLQRNGVRYAPAAPIPMHLIDEKRSRMNQARRDAIVSDSVDRFAAALRNGAVFPPIVVYEAANRLVIVDGNNRQAAARKAGHDTIAGFLIAADTPSELIAALTVEANTHHGVTPDPYWRIRQAFHLVSLGFTDQQAAEKAAVSVSQLRNARSVQEADQRAKALRINGFADLAMAVRQSLNALKDESVFFQAAKLTVEAAMTHDEVRDLVRAVKALPSEGARVEHIGAVAAERTIERATRRVLGKAAARVSSVKSALVTGIGKVLAVDETLLCRQIVTTHDRDQINARIRLLERKVATLKVAMSTLDHLDEQEQ